MTHRNTYATLYGLLIVSGIASCLAALWLPTPLNWKIYHQTRIAIVFMAIGAFVGADAIRPDVERDKAVRDGKADAIGRNEIALTHLQTQPTRQMLRQINQTTVTPQEIPARSIAQEIAAYDGHIAWVSKTRSGKTSQIIAAIEQAQALGHQVILLDGKGDMRLKSLRNIQYWQVNRVDRVEAAKGVIQDLVDELADRQDGIEGSPISLFIDEFNLIRPLAKIKPSGSWFDEPIERLILQGAGYGMFCRIAAHTSRVKDWGMNTGVLDSLSFVALSRLGAHESIEDLIRHQITGRKAKVLQAQLDDLPDGLGETPLILTTLAPLGFCRPNAGNLGSTLPGDTAVLAPKSEDSDVAELPRELQPLAVYIADRGSVHVRAIKNNFGRNNGFDARSIDDMLIRLNEWEVIEIKDGRVEWLNE